MPMTRLERGWMTGHTNTMQYERIKANARRNAKRSFNRLFNLCDRMGFHAVPKHYYSPLIDHAWLQQHKELWTGRLKLHDVTWNLDRQVEWLKGICAPYYDEVRGLGLYGRVAQEGWGPGFWRYCNRKCSTVLCARRLRLESSRLVAVFLLRVCARRAE